MTTARMRILAERELVAILPGGSSHVRVALFEPLLTGENWLCYYQIDWPDRVRRASVGGVDAMQAIVLALQTIGAELHAARPPDVREVYWLAQGGGAGFPLPPALRAAAAGEDKLI